MEHLRARRKGAGARLRLVPGLFWLLVGCAVEPLPPSDPELRAELGIPDEVLIHRVDLSGRADENRVIPRVTSLRVGEIIQFVVLDRRVHLIRFREDALTPAQLAFLRETDQLSFPPLVERGMRLVLSFADAPPGSYRFVVEGNGPPVDGEIVVSME